MDESGRLRRKAQWAKIWPNIFAWAITLVVVSPFLWLIMLSFKDKSEILSNPVALPASLNFDNYLRVFETIDLPNMYKNTFIIVVLHQKISSVGMYQEVSN